MDDAQPDQCCDGLCPRGRRYTWYTIVVLYENGVVSRAKRREPFQRFRPTARVNATRRGDDDHIFFGIHTRESECILGMNIGALDSQFWDELGALAGRQQMFAALF
jgi:hypothetical protein